MPFTSLVHPFMGANRSRGFDLANCYGGALHIRRCHLLSAGPLAASLSLLVLGCTTQGQVFVSQPQVFRRARLVDERIREYGWAESQLSKNVKPVLSGVRDVREFKSFSESLSVSFDPLSTAEKATQQAAAIRAKTDVLKAKAEQAQVRNPGTSTTAATDVSVSGTAATAMEKPADQAAQSPSPETSLEANKQKGSEEQANSGSHPLPKASDAGKSTTKLDAIETFQYQRAVRETINATMRQNQLDDTHDLYGATLYSLQFDLAVFPGNRSSENAIVELQILPPDNLGCAVGYYDAWHRKEYERWVSSVRTDVHEQQIDVQKRHQHDELTLEERQRIKSIVLRDDQDKALANYVARRFENGLQFSHPDKLEEQGALLKISQGLSNETGYWTSAVEADVHGSSYDGHNDNGQNRFWLKMCYMPYEGRSQAFVEYVEPKEYSQNISDVSASEMLSKMVISLQAAAPQYGLKGSNYAEWMRDSQALLQTIARQPLVVGYGNGSRRFGWIVGPRFKIDGGRAIFTHTASHQSVSVAISAPLWWTSFRLVGHVGWHKGNGEIEWQRIPWWRFIRWQGHHDLNEEFLRTTAYETVDTRRVGSDRVDFWGIVYPRAEVWGGAITVPLPADPKALTQAFLAEDDPGTGVPAITSITAGVGTVAPKQGSRQGDGVIYLRADSCEATSPEANNSATQETQDIYIRGKELWRNPRVFLGAQRADSVEVLPDMQGLVAHFASVLPPIGRPGHDTSGSALDLRVVTSVDETVLEKAVIVLEPRPCSVPRYEARVIRKPPVKPH